MNKNDSYRKRLRNVISKTEITDEQFEMIVQEASSLRCKGKVLQFFKENPTASFSELSQFGRMNWMPLIVISDEKIDFAALYAKEDRLMDKLMMYREMLGDYQVWNDIVFDSIQFCYADALEGFLDSHTETTYDDIKQFCFEQKIDFHRSLGIPYPIVFNNEEI